MIEVTPEMIRVAQAATECDPAECDECIGKAIAAALAIVERDQAGPCQVELHMLVNGPSTVCELRHGHLGDHVSGVTRWRLNPAPCPEVHDGTGWTCDLTEGHGGPHQVASRRPWHQPVRVTSPNSTGAQP